MSFESDLYTVLSAECDRVFPDFAPVSTQRPYVTFQQFGGDVINMLDNAPPGTRFAYVQVNVWSDTRMESLEIARAIEDAMRGATEFFAAPMAALACDFDADVPVYGTRQDFRCRFTA